MSYGLVFFHPTSVSNVGACGHLQFQGESLAQLKRGGKERFKAARKRIGKDLLHELANAWGYMIFSEVHGLPLFLVESNALGLALQRYALPYSLPLYTL